ncbi:MAG: methyltransferase domain-containing protein [Betaproteobacteria bacterium]|jgi:SAM-dependent methyltransferase|nr:methyltransferase domain-containing protein [Betaproteobacteria bacterium]MDH5341915.1 methyltransferase domain-containing protein [Betaproteobacteria bacterium]
MPANDAAQKPIINVCILQPPGYIHALALLEAAEYVAEKCTLAGYQARLSKNRVLSGGLNIVFGAHIKPEKNLSLPPNTVIFNTEQVPEKSVWISSEYKNCLDRHFVWDYSQSNLALLHDRAQRIDFFHVEKLQRITLQEHREFDLIFYGSMNERRKAIIEELRNRGLNVLVVFGLYGPERDELLGKARAVLNLHFYESQLFQQIRAFYALSNGVPVISENFPEDSAPALYKDVIFTPGRIPFVDYVLKLLKDNGQFESAVKEKISRFQATTNDAEFQKTLEKTIGAVLRGDASGLSRPQVPVRINLGSGKDYRPGYLNIDINRSLNPDIVVDLAAPVDFPVSVSSPTFESVVLAENQFDEIIAFDVLEHVQQLPQLMGNCLKLLKEGGRFTILVPYDLSLGAWQDPTHVRAFNENSWLYYTQWFWYLGWFDYRFDCTETNLNLSSYGQSLVSSGTPQDEVMRTPRAVDSMRVVLTKRKTTPEEKTLARSYSNEFINR